MPDKFAKTVAKIAEPRKDFLLADDLFKSPKTTQNVHRRIFAEFVESFRRMASIALTSCKMDEDGKKATLRLRHSAKDTKFEIEFDQDIIGLWYEGKHVMDSNVYGANVNKDTDAVTSIKVDLASLKSKICAIVSDQEVK